MTLPMLLNPQSKLTKSHKAAVKRIAASLKMDPEYIQEAIDLFFSGDDGFFAYIRRIDEEFEIPYVGTGMIKSPPPPSPKIQKTREEKLLAGKKLLEWKLQKERSEYRMSMKRAVSLIVKHNLKARKELSRINKKKEKATRKIRKRFKKKRFFTKEECKNYHKEVSRMRRYKRKIIENKGRRPRGRPPKHKYSKKQIDPVKTWEVYINSKKRKKIKDLL